jgi:hypothetical protein
VSAKAAAELLGLAPAALAALWRAGKLVPEVGMLPSAYRTIADPVAPRPATYYRRSSVERFGRRSSASRGGCGDERALGRRRGCRRTALRAEVMGA